MCSRLTRPRKKPEIPEGLHGNHTLDEACRGFAQSLSAELGSALSEARAHNPPAGREGALVVGVSPRPLAASPVCRGKWPVRPGRDEAAYRRDDRSRIVRFCFPPVMPRPLDGRRQREIPRGPCPPVGVALTPPRRCQRLSSVVGARGTGRAHSRGKFIGSGRPRSHGEPSPGGRRARRSRALIVCTSRR